MVSTEVGGVVVEILDVGLGVIEVVKVKELVLTHDVGLEFVELGIAGSLEVVLDALELSNSIHEISLESLAVWVLDGGLLGVVNLEHSSLNLWVGEDWGELLHESSLGLILHGEGLVLVTLSLLLKRTDLGFGGIVLGLS